MAASPIVTSMSLGSSRAIGHPAIGTYLEDHIDVDSAMITLARPEGHFTLVVDASYVELARAAQQVDPTIVDGLMLPRVAVLAVIAGWPDEWLAGCSDLRVHVSQDGVPHLRLFDSSSPTVGADEDVTRP